MKKKQTDVPKLSSKSSTGNRLEKAVRFNMVDNYEAGGKETKLSLADGTVLSKESGERFVTALKQTTGTDDTDYATAVLSQVSRGLPDSTEEQRLTRMASLLPALRPQDETEALLAGQFVALQASAMECLSQARLQDMFYHVERYLHLATKLFNVATQTMQALTKYRAKGQQTVQVIHVHNEGQAIVAQNLSSGGGVGK